MRGNSQLMRSAGAVFFETANMKTRVMLLLTKDYELEVLVADALSRIGAISHLVHDAGEALEAIRVATQK